MVAPWPKPSSKLLDEEAEAFFGRFQAVIMAIRNTRIELNVPLESRPPVRLLTKEPLIRKFFEGHRPLMQAMAQVGEITVGGTAERPKDAAASVVDGVEVLVPLAGVIDVERERVRLKQKVDELTNHITRLEARLRDPQFTQKAPKEVVDHTKTQRDQTRETLKKLSEHLAVIQSM